MTMVIRNAVIGDAPQLAPLLAQLGYTNIEVNEIEEKIEYYSKPDYALLVSWAEYSVNAFIALHIFEMFHSMGKVGRITAFCVDEKFRSKGIGSKMLKEAELYLINNNCTRIEVTSNNRRKEAHSFYLNRNYIEDSRKFVKYLS
jgi:ribosomal protein S18 acetylase RimI-like enzyme